MQQSTTLGLTRGHIEMLLLALRGADRQFRFATNRECLDPRCFASDCPKVQARESIRQAIEMLESMYPEAR